MSAAIILADGRSMRMGKDKRHLRLWGPRGPTLLAHTVALAASMCSEVIVVLNDVEAWPDLPARLVPDAYPRSGPLGGLASGLAALTSDRALLLTYAMPLLEPALLRALLAAPVDGEALVLRRRADTGETGRVIEALPAVYRRSCLHSIVSCLAHDEQRIEAAARQLAVRYLDPSWWMRFDTDGHSFMNLNRPEDLSRALQLLDSSAQLVPAFG